jgi:hypothetical protein
MATLLGNIVSIPPYDQIETISVLISFVTSLAGALGMSVIIFATLQVLTLGDLEGAHLGN